MTKIKPSDLRDLIKNPEFISKLMFDEVLPILQEARKFLTRESLLIELEINRSDEGMHVIGDFHGNLYSLTKPASYAIINNNKIHQHNVEVS